MYTGDMFSKWDTEICWQHHVRTCGTFKKRYNSCNS